MKKIVVLGFVPLALVAAASILSSGQSVDVVVSHSTENEDWFKDFVKENKHEYAVDLLRCEHLNIADNLKGRRIGAAISGLYSDLSDKDVVHKLNLFFKKDMETISSLEKEGSLILKSIDEGFAETFVASLGSDMVDFESDDSQEENNEEQLHLEAIIAEDTKAPEPEEVDPEKVGIDEGTVNNDANFGVGEYSENEGEKEVSNEPEQTGVDGPVKEEIPSEIIPTKKSKKSDTTEDK